ncbi:hypothetical protein G436_3477 [Leptospira interrogans serovar Hardjo str. Norma]|uniref:Uncharacterized protein n=1 Tax=Leptospira interrogans serovar Hardjo str. Norma TaxID=1279460 RepID=A0A0M4NB71_LEPIR|nr:hypothetical protein G436_3477 [Leptospira interrogans serovar Hardjo str. Norma]
MKKLDWMITNFKFYRDSLRSILGQVLNKKLKSQPFSKCHKFKNR